MTTCYGPSTGHQRMLSIRILSAARHDGDAQDGRYSLGENDRPAEDGQLQGRHPDRPWCASVRVSGSDREPCSGAKPALWRGRSLPFVLSDKVNGGMSPSLYDTTFRMHPDAFAVGSGCCSRPITAVRGVSDPIDGACFAFSPANWPRPLELKRRPLFTDPDDTSVPAPMRYLWRFDDSFGSIGTGHRGQGQRRRLSPSTEFWHLVG